MNAHAHPDPLAASRPLSEALASLSLAPVAAQPSPQGRCASRILVRAGAVVLLATLGAAAAVPLMGGLPLVGLFSPSEGLDSDPAGALPMGEAPQSPLASSPRHVAGSGHVVALAQAAVQSRRGGTIVELVAEIGDVVTAGQKLLRLDDPDLGFALRTAELARRRAELALAARRLDAADAEALGRRMAALAATGVVNGQSARDAGTAAERSANLVDQAAASLAEAELAVSKARQAIDELTVRAPIAGVVSVRSANLGETILAQVDARGEASLFTITDPARLAVDIDIAETNVAAVQPGLKGEAILDAYPDRPFAVMVQRVAPVASAERGTLALRLAILDPPVGIRPAMAVRVSLFLDAPTAAGAITSNVTGP